MATLTNLRDYMRDWLSTSSTRLSDSAATQCINIAIREILRTRDLSFAEAIITQAITSGDNDYALSAISATDPISRVWAIYYQSPTNSSAFVRLNEISFEEFQAKYGHVAAMSSGSPVDWAIYGDVVYLGPTPDSSFNAYVVVNKLFADLSTGSDHNNLTDYGWEAVLFRALAYACQYMLEDDRWQMFAAMAERHLAELEREHRARKYVGKSAPQLQEPN